MALEGCGFHVGLPTATIDLLLHLFRFLASSPISAVFLSSFTLGNLEKIFRIFPKYIQLHEFISKLVAKEYIGPDWFKAPLTKSALAGPPLWPPNYGHSALNYGRTGASACYSPWHRKVIVAGGTSTYLDDYTLYDLRNVELLDARPRFSGSSSLSTNKWIACKDKIPGIFGANVEAFSLYDKIILVDIEYNKVYEGRILPEETNNLQRHRDSDSHLTEFEIRGQVNWNKAVIPQVNILWSAFPEIKKRHGHAIVVLGNRLLLCIGDRDLQGPVRRCFPSHP